MNMAINEYLNLIELNTIPLRLYNNHATILKAKYIDNINYILIIVEM